MKSLGTVIWFFLFFEHRTKLKIPSEITPPLLILKSYCWNCHLSTIFYPRCLPALRYFKVEFLRYCFAACAFCYFFFQTSVPESWGLISFKEPTLTHSPAAINLTPTFCRIFLLANHSLLRTSVLAWFGSKQFQLVSTWPVNNDLATNFSVQMTDTKRRVFLIKFINETDYYMKHLII